MASAVHPIVKATAGSEIGHVRQRCKWSAEEAARFPRRSDVKTTRQLGSDLAGRRSQILLVDRHALMRTAAAGWINQSSTLEVCGTAGGMAAAFRAIQRLHPDLVISEIMRPHDLGFIRELRRRHPRLPILVFSLQDATLYAARAREAGASVFLMKHVSGEALVRSVRALLGRRKVVGHALMAVGGAQPRANGLSAPHGEVNSVKTMATASVRPHRRSQGPVFC